MTAATSCSSPNDPRTTSVAELRRKAQEHSAALLQSLQAAAAAGFSFPAFNLPPHLSLHSALSNSRKSMINDFQLHATRSTLNAVAGNNNNNDISPGSLATNNNNSNSNSNNGVTLSNSNSHSVVNHSTNGEQAHSTPSDSTEKSD